MLDAGCSPRSRKYFSRFLWTASWMLSLLIFLLSLCGYAGQRKSPWSSDDLAPLLLCIVVTVLLRCYNECTRRPFFLQRGGIVTVPQPYDQKNDLPQLIARRKRSVNSSAVGIPHRRRDPVRTSQCVCALYGKQDTHPKNCNALLNDYPSSALLQLSGGEVSVHLFVGNGRFPGKS